MSQGLEQKRAEGVAAAVRKARETALMTQEMLATACDLSERTVRRLETDGTASFETLRAIAAVLPINIPAIYREVALETVSVPRALWRLTRRSIVWLVIAWLMVAGAFVAAVAQLSPEFAQQYMTQPMSPLPPGADRRIFHEPTAEEMHGSWGQSVEVTHAIWNMSAFLVLMLTAARMMFMPPSSKEAGVVSDWIDGGIRRAWARCRAVFIGATRA